MTVPAEQQTWFTRAEAQEYTRSSKRTILRAVQSGDLQWTKTGSRGDLRFRREWLETWLARYSSSSVEATP